MESQPIGTKQSTLPPVFEPKGKDGTTTFAPPGDTSSLQKTIAKLGGSIEEQVPAMEPNEPPLGTKDGDYDETEELPESVIEGDERSPISPATSTPYKWVCSLRMTYQNGKRYIGTGFFCSITGSDKLAVVTCAHNLWSARNGGYATNVDVIPGRDGNTAPFGWFKATAVNLRVPAAYKEKPQPEYDFGVIVVDQPTPGNANFGFGFRVLKDKELKNRIVQTCGYPGDKPAGTMWIAGGVISHTSDHRIFYSNDTYGGQSGSPVWTWSGWNFILIGVHGYGLRVRNSARRVNPFMVSQIAEWVNEFK